MYEEDFIIKKNKNSTFKVTHPNGGERFGIGTDTGYNLGKDAALKKRSL